ncbi:hypothetical protein GOP47_0014281 [Adiantum capillus-veneris]|uniref:Uncharacterized protein n=1 Tax=Adiantum capillus-veneris TaxID=13818 RepID=A0A9D4ZBZ4_ADICA|nr:hypothetical protein GOP47_0014281 [Adiantum capillus-veneris]
MLDKEIEALGLLAYKRGLFYESKKDSLRQDIERLRNFLEAMAKDRVLMQKQAKAEHILCKKKLVKTEIELQDTQNRMRAMETEAACLLESKHTEMERLQKERDDALAKIESLCAESCFLRGYGNHLERKVCALVIKLHEYHQQLQRKAEEVVQTRGRSVDDWEWIRQSMANFENNLLEFQSANAQLSLEKENYMKELQDMKQLERISSDKSNDALAQAEEKLYLATQTAGELQGELQKMDCNYQSATQRAEVISSQLDEANATISALQDQVDKLHGQLETMEEKTLDLIKDKLEADAATQLREAAISVLKLRIYALEGDLQKEVFLRANHLPDSHLKYLTQFSPAIDVEVRANRPATSNKPVWTEGGNACVSAKTDLKTFKKQQDGVCDMPKRPDNQQDVSKGVLLDQLGSDAWSMEKIRKLEQTLTGAHQKYMLLSQCQKMPEPKVELIQSYRGNNLYYYRTQPAHGSHVQCSWQDSSPSENVHSHASLQNSHCSTEDESVSENSAEIVNQFLGNKDSRFMPSKATDARNDLAMSNNRGIFDQSYVQMEYGSSGHRAPYDHGKREDFVKTPFQQGKSSKLELDDDAIYGSSFRED